MTSERKCEGCRWWFLSEPSDIGGNCSHELTAFPPLMERSDKNPSACGSAGRYWEPREEEK